jgi:hypothetical protein
MENPEEMELEKELLDELMEFARGGMARDMRQRYGKEMPAETVEEVPEDPEIPGVEAVPGEAGGEGGEEIDPEKLKALLASMGGTEG